MAAPNNKLLPHTLTNTSIFPAKRNEFPVIVTSVSLRTDSSNLMKAKKSHIDECYVCIISFIRSVLALTLAFMPWPWPWSYEALALRPWLWP